MGIFEYLVKEKYYCQPQLKGPRLSRKKVHIRSCRPHYPALSYTIRADRFEIATITDY